jgi:hypothetical protein
MSCAIISNHHQRVKEFFLRVRREGHHRISISQLKEDETILYDDVGKKCLGLNLLESNIYYLGEYTLNYISYLVVREQSATISLLFPIFLGAGGRDRGRKHEETKGRRERETNRQKSTRSIVSTQPTC